MASHPETAAIILAADGRPDARLDGDVVLKKVLEMVTDWGVAAPVVVVFSKRTDSLLDAVDLGDAVAVIDEDGSSRSSAVSVGLDALTHLHPDASAAFVVDGDVPGVPPDLAELLMAELTSSGRMAAAPQYRYVRSGPILVGRQLWDRLMALESDQPLAEFLKAHPEWTAAVVISERAPMPIS